MPISELELCWKQNWTRFWNTSRHQLYWGGSKRQLLSPCKSCPSMSLMIWLDLNIYIRSTDNNGTTFRNLFLTSPVLHIVQSSRVTNHTLLPLYFHAAYVRFLFTVSIISQMGSEPDLRCSTSVWVVCLALLHIGFIMSGMTYNMMYPFMKPLGLLNLQMFFKIWLAQKVIIHILACESFYFMSHASMD